MHRRGFPLKVVLGSVLYILSGLLVQSVNLVKQAVLRQECRFIWEEKALDTCWSSSLVIYFLRSAWEKDREAESQSGGSVNDRVEGMVLYSQFKVSRSRHSQQWCLLAWPEISWRYQGGGGGACLLFHKFGIHFAQWINPYYIFSALTHASSLSLEETSLCKNTQGNIL